MMELDGNEYDRYLAATNAFPSLPTGRNASARGINGHGPHGHSAVDRPGVGGRRASTPGMVGAVGMDEIVAENARELRRRSLANGFNLDFIEVDDSEADTFSQMVSPGAFSAGDMSQMGNEMGRLPTTIESFSEMDASAPELSAVRMMGVGNISGPEIQSSISMYADPQVLSGTSHSSPVTNSMAVSVPQSPVGPQMPGSPLGPGSHGHRMSVDSITSSPMAQMHMAQMSNQGMDQSLMDPMGGMTPSSQYSPMDVNKHFTETTYSSTGFDMLGILYRVANRPNPQINIGAVDLSCSFVVTDARKFDNPIVYCSATFERLTGYTKHEILGRNCRFLQAPDAKIVPGVKRKYVDDDAVYYLKNQIQAKKEAQTSLINYRKGGQPFTNLLTMIPITWDSPEVVYFVGFQVDLVEQPGAMVNRNKDGSFAINYQYSQLPTYVPAAAAALVMDSARSGLTVARDDVSHVLSSFGSGDSEFHSKRILDKVLLENTDDVVHVLSLKGLFLYCSPSIRKVLEYEPQELVGTSLSAVCHPSDIVPVTRDLKDTSSSTSVNVVFRIRRKFSGYTWFESHGSLHTEQGKGRKCIILVGRERPVYRLGWREVQVTGGIGDNELWTKMSTSGMFLFVSSNAKTLLDRDGEELTGTSVQALMRPDSKNELGRALENARNGTKATVKHEIQNKRGQFLQALTTLFPGDGTESQKPTFLVAQTRLLKHTRASAGSPTKNHQSDTLSSAASTPSWSNNSPNQAVHMTNGADKTPPDSRENSAESTADENLFEELKTTRSTSWQFELRQLQRTNKRLVEELSSLVALRKKRKRRKGVDQLEKDCANCHTRVTPEWRRGPSGKRDLCNSCGLRYAKLIGRVSPRTATSNSDKGNTSPTQSQSSPITTHSMGDSPHLSSAKTAGMTPIPISPVHQQLRRGSMSGNMPTLQPHPTSAPHINGNGEIEMKVNGS
ncbi:tuber borchii white collar-1 [Tuber indicum]|nr:tuber borchii white collar-1 [Tuber indicum]